MKGFCAKISAVFICLALCLSLFSCGKTKLETFIDSDDFQSQVEEMSSSYESQGLKLSVSARGQSVVYTCQYTSELDEETIASMKKTLDNALSDSSMTSAFENILSTVKENVSDTESVIVEYTDKDGNVITSYEYK
jgi:hypothetical protein